MRYLMVNSKYGTKVIAPSEKARDNILDNSKKGKDAKKLWSVDKELPDAVAEVEVFDPVAERERIRAELKAEMAAKPKGKPGRKPGFKVKPVEEVKED